MSPKVGLIVRRTPDDYTRIVVQSMRRGIYVEVRNPLTLDAVRVALSNLVEKLERDKEGF